MNAIDYTLYVISKESRQRTDRRYIAKPFNGDAKNWGVYDQKTGRYLTNSEVEALKPSDVREGL